MSDDGRQGLGASVPDQALAVPVEPVARLDPTGFDPSRVADLELALELALAALVKFEPGDSRAVSDEFVAMAAILCNLNDNLDECRSIIRAAIAAEAGTAETVEQGSVHESAVPERQTPDLQSGPHHPPEGE